MRDPHWRLVGSLLSALVLTWSLSAHASSVDIEPAPPDPNAGPTIGWQKITDYGPLHNLPTDGFINLGLRWYGGCYNPDPLANLEFDANDWDGNPVPGTIMVAEHLGGMIVWQPNEPLEPDSIYGVAVRTPDLATECGTGSLLVAGNFDTGPGAASGPARMDVVEVPNCTPESSTFRITTTDDPFVDFKLMSNSSAVLEEARSPFERTVTLDGTVGGTECFEAIATHVLTGESLTLKGCRSPDLNPTCPAQPAAEAQPQDPGAGCSATPGMPGLLVLTVIALGLLLRRRRGLAT